MLTVPFIAVQQNGLQRFDSLLHACQTLVYFLDNSGIFGLILARRAAPQQLDGDHDRPPDDGRYQYKASKNDGNNQCFFHIPYQVSIRSDYLCMLKLYTGLNQEESLLGILQFSRAKMDATAAELQEEAAAVAHLV